jgi:hypothetical protein
MSGAAFGLAPSRSQRTPEQLSKQQLNTLIANAKTPAEHERIARRYETKAQDYPEQAKEHEATMAVCKANSSLSNDKNWTATIGHCEYYLQTFNGEGGEKPAAGRTPRADGQGRGTEVRCFRRKCLRCTTLGPGVQLALGPHLQDRTFRTIKAAKTRA